MTFNREKVLESIAQFRAVMHSFEDAMISDAELHTCTDEQLIKYIKQLHRALSASLCCLDHVTSVLKEVWQ